MLRLNASFSKKVPVADQEYSSQSYHASVEVEIPDGLSPEQLRDRIHDTFALVRESVENELGRDAPALSVTTQQQPQQPAAPTPRAEVMASPRQVQFLTRLALNQGMDLRALNLICREDFGATSVEALSRRQASEFIDRLNGRSGSTRQTARRAA